MGSYSSINNKPQKQNNILPLRLSKVPNSPIFASCGEDRSLRVWNLERKEECIQTIHLPAQSVWSVTFMKNGDIVSGSRYVSNVLVQVLNC